MLEEASKVVFSGPTFFKDAVGPSYSVSHLAFALFC